MLRGSFYKRLVITGVISWFIGITAYFSLLSIFYGETIEDADFIAALAWSFAAALLTFPTIYTPILLLMRRFLGGCKPAIAFPVLAALICIIPTVFIIWMFSTSTSSFLQGLLSREALLFYCLFIIAGISFGIGFVWSCRSDYKK